jgi:hypothetical protein
MSELRSTCPACNSTRVNISGHQGERECRACGHRWQSPDVDRTGASKRDYVGALRRDRFERREPGALWKREA